jgi:hypothetical protein
MSREFEQRLDDIIESCDRVADYISGYDLAKFEDDYKTQDAVIRQFEIIGGVSEASAGEYHAAGTGDPLAPVCGFQGCIGAFLLCRRRFRGLGSGEGFRAASSRGVRRFAWLMSGLTSC